MMSTMTGATTERNSVQTTTTGTPKRGDLMTDTIDRIDQEDTTRTTLSGSGQVNMDTDTINKTEKPEVIRQHRRAFLS